MAAISIAAGATYIANKAAEIKEKRLEKDAGKEWKKDIQEREDLLKEKHEKQSQILAHNHVMQESQLKDAKKEGYEVKLVQLEKTIKEEKERIDKKFEQEKKQLDVERERLEKIGKEFQQKAESIKAEQQKTAEQKEKEQRELEKTWQEEIERQRKETDRERQMELSR